MCIDQHHRRFSIAIKVISLSSSIKAPSCLSRVRFFRSRLEATIFLPLHSKHGQKCVKQHFSRLIRKKGDSRGESVKAEGIGVSGSRNRERKRKSETREDMYEKKEKQRGFRARRDRENGIRRKNRIKTEI